MQKLRRDISARAKATAPHPLLGPADVAALAARHGITLRDVELAALDAGVLPERYERNARTFGLAGQKKLLQSSALVVGAGGLGGHICNVLARAGVGRLVIADGDVFAPSNLNRQTYSSVETLGANKAAVAAKAIAGVNPAVETVIWQEFATKANLDAMMAGCQVVLDGLDDITARLMLEQVCMRRGLPLVHAAIAGFVIQATTVFPGDPGLAALYGSAPPKGAEKSLGSPGPPPAAAAAVQAAEALKILLGQGPTLQGKLLIMDLWENIHEVMQLQ